MFFVSVRGELDEPVVLREIRRVTDHLREQPGVANAWSVADLFMGVTLEGDEASRIPDDPEQVRRILVQARTDPAVRLELAGDHREALIAVRFDSTVSQSSTGLLKAWRMRGLSGSPERRTSKPSASSRPSAPKYLWSR